MPWRRALSPGVAPGQNFPHSRLVDPAAKEFQRTREVTGNASNDPRMLALIEEFSSDSARFREPWTRADVGYRAGITRMRHPVVGEMYLHRHQLSVPHSGGQHVIIFRAEPKSPSAQALDQLRSPR
jgi:hypothetical protein